MKNDNCLQVEEKMEKLYSLINMVKQLQLHCQYLTTANVMYKSLSGSQGGHSSSDASPSSSQVNPFNLQGGTILLPALPAPGPSQHLSSGSSLGLQMSQGYTQMYGGRSNEEVEDISVVFWLLFRESCQAISVLFKALTLHLIKFLT